MKSSMKSPSRKKILILNHGNATQFIDVSNQYARVFDQEHYEVTAVYLTGEPDETVKKRTLADNVIFLNQNKKAIRGLKLTSIKKLLALCRTEKFSVVICHRYKPSYIMLWVAQFCKIPVIFFVMHQMKTMAQIKRKLLAAFLWRKNMYLAGVSNAVRDELRNDVWHIPTQRVITLYNCIDLELTEPQLLPKDIARQELCLAAGIENIPQDTFIFGTIGRLVPDKDQQTCLHAFAKIKTQSIKPNMKLIIVGVGALDASLKQLANDIQIEKDVIFTGYVPEAFRCIKAFDAFVLSSTKEAFGRVLLEAMVGRIPVIATRINGIPEVMGDTGLLIDAKNPDQLANAMQTLLKQTPEQHDAIVKNAYARVHDHFSLDCFRKDFLVYCKLPFNAE